MLFLAKRGVARQRKRIRTETGDARQSVCDMDDCPPFREASAHAMVLLEPIPQPVEPLGDRLVRRAGERLRAGVDLDAGEDTLVREHVSEWRAIGTLLTNGLVLHNDTADEFVGAPGGE